MRFSLNPPASISLDISPDNITYYNVVSLELPAGLGTSRFTVPILLYNGWYANWSLNNALLERIRGVYL